MPDEISLKDVERKMFVSGFQDGLVEIALGAFLLTFIIALYLSPALGDLWGTVAGFLPLWLIVIPGLLVMRRYVIKPRLGTVKYGSWRTTRLMRFNLITLLVLVLAAALGVLSTVDFQAIPGWVHTARFAFIFLVTFSLAGYFLDFPRLYLYGALVALAPLIGEVLYQYLDVPHHGIPVTFGFSAGILILSGAVLFIRFLHEHPLPDSQTGSIGSGE